MDISIVTWAQSLPNGPKYAVSAVIVLVCVSLIFILWQKPPETAPAAPTVSQSGNATSTGQSGGVTVSGNATSANQTGGITAGSVGVINQAPPVTDQQKEQALSSIQSEIEELAFFPNRSDMPAPRTLLQVFAVNNVPRQLFVILSRYYKDTIKAVPKNGTALFDFKVAYYNFESRQVGLENETAEQISKMVSVVRWRAGWNIYLRYFLLRSAGFSQENISGGENFLNFNITWNDAERVFGELAKNPEITQGWMEQLSKLKDLGDLATRILSTYGRP